MIDKNNVRKTEKEHPGYIKSLVNSLDTSDGEVIQEFNFEMSGKYFEKPNPVKVTKVGRNEPCPCGSGKKFKKCCGK